MQIMTITAPGDHVDEIHLHAYRSARRSVVGRPIGSKLGLVEVTAASKEEAQVKLQNELQYRVELCPCSGVSGPTVELQVQEEGGRHER